MARIIGLDIGSFSIKVVHLSRKGKGFRLEAIGIALNPIGMLPGDDEQSQKRVAETTKKMLSDVKLTNSKAVLALTESLVYSRVVELPALSDSELASAINWEAEQYIPVPIDQVNIDYEVISRPKKGSPDVKMKVFLVAARKELIKRTVAFAEKCGVDVLGLETETLAVARAMLTESFKNDATMLVNFGASSTDISVIKAGMPLMTHAIESGGTAITRSLAKELGLEFSQAEEYKRSYGLDTSQLEGRVSNSIKPMVDQLLSEVKKAMQYYNNSNQQEPIKRLVLSGGSALLPEFITYVAKYLSVEVVLGNAFINVEPSKSAQIPTDTVSFATAVGLAMREI